MMRSVEALRQRGGSSVEGTVEYTQLQQLEEDEEKDYWASGDELGVGRRRRWRSKESAGAGEGRRLGDRESDLWPHYTPLYTNMKVLRRKRLDASMVYYRAGPGERSFPAAEGVVCLFRDRFVLLRSRLSLKGI